MVGTGKVGRVRVGTRGGRAVRVIGALILRETAARFGRSAGGYAWALAEPVGGIVLLSVAFAFIAPKPPLGPSFMLFYATGIIPFMMYNSITVALMAALAANRGLMIYPVVRPLDLLLARATLEALTQTLVAVLILVPLVLVAPTPPEIVADRIVAGLALAFALGLGVGTFNAAIAGLWPTWRQIWSILNRPLFVLSGILFTTRSLPSGLRDLLAWNPVTHAIETLREGLYGPDPQGFAQPGLALAPALALFLAGAVIIARCGRKMPGI